MFAARAVVDDIVPPKFITTTLEGHYPACAERESRGDHRLGARPLVRQALHGARAARVGDPEKSPIDAAKAAIQDLLREA